MEKREQTKVIMDETTIYEIDLECLECKECVQSDSNSQKEDK